MESGYIKKKEMKDMSNSGHQYLRLKVSLLAAWSTQRSIRDSNENNAELST